MLMQLDGGAVLNAQGYEQLGAEQHLAARGDGEGKRNILD